MNRNKKTKQQNLNRLPQSLYIHIPFCNQICHYCDFIKVCYRQEWAFSYLKELEKELKSYRIKDLKTIYIGGGTPSSLSYEQLKILLTMVEPYARKVEEYTIEINPESLDLEKALLFKHFGINRVSIGVQTTDDDVLRFINRQHNHTMVKKAFEYLRKANIININVDLILGLPLIDKDKLKLDVQRLLELHPTHFSCYSLKIMPHTVFYNQKIQEIDDDTSYDQYSFVDYLLTSQGYIHYEVSNWGLDGFFSKHNLTYWRNEEYYGCGVSASGYFGGIRYKNTSSLTDYFNGVRQVEKDQITSKDDEEYEIMLRLRTIEGIDDKSFATKFHHSFVQKYAKQIKNLVNSGFLVNQNRRIYPTFRGLMALDYVILTLLDERK